MDVPPVPTDNPTYTVPDLPPEVFVPAAYPPGTEPVLPEGIEPGAATPPDFPAPVQPEPEPEPPAVTQAPPEPPAVTQPSAPPRKRINTEWQMDPEGWGTFGVAYDNGYSVLVYDPEQHLKMLGSADARLSDPERFEVTITHAGSVCDVNPLNRGQFDSLDHEHVTNILNLVQDMESNTSCTHGRTARSVGNILLGMSRTDPKYRDVCPRCQGNGELRDAKGRIRSCNCIEGYL
jgi:hypothetical protein